MNDLLSRNTAKQFAAFAHEKGAPPYQQILVEGAFQLLKGLSERDVEIAFEEEGLSDLLQISYTKIYIAMGNANRMRGNLISFLSQMEIIHQEIQNILAITSIKHGYDPDQFSKALEKKLTSGDSPVIPLGFRDSGFFLMTEENMIPQWVMCEVKCFLKPSAMGAFSSTLASVEAEKGNNALNVVVLKDCYYEMKNALQINRTYNVSVLDGEAFREKGGFEFYNVPKKPIDLFVCEFNHNITSERKEYFQENVLDQIKQMNYLGWLANRCTVIVDTTLELDQSIHIRKMLGDSDITNLIDRGKLCLVFLRSAQKFDMLGMDNYYGGIVTTINKGIKFATFNERMKTPQDQLGGLSYQGMAHLGIYAGEILDRYKEAIIQNNNLLYNILSKTIEPNGRLQIAKFYDDPQGFIHIYAEGLNLRDIEGLIRNMAKRRGLNLTNKPSFGFAVSNLIHIGSVGLRFNAGLESSEDIEAFAKIFQELMGEINSAPQWKVEITIRQLEQFYRD